MLDRYITGFFEGQPKNTIGAAFAAKKVTRTSVTFKLQTCRATHGHAEVLRDGWCRSHCRTDALYLLEYGIQLVQSGFRASAECIIMVVGLQ